MTSGMTYDEAQRLTKLETIVCNELPHIATDIAEIKLAIEDVRGHLDSVRDLKIEVAKNQEGVANNRFWIRRGLPAILALAAVVGTALSTLLP